MLGKDRSKLLTDGNNDKQNLGQLDYEVHAFAHGLKINAYMVVAKKLKWVLKIGVNQ